MSSKNHMGYIPQSIRQSKIENLGQNLSFRRLVSFEIFLQEAGVLWGVGVLQEAGVLTNIQYVLSPYEAAVPIC